MKLTRRISAVIGAFGVVVLLSRWLAVPMADWAVRTAGVLTLLSLFVLAFTTARQSSGKNQKTEARHED